MYPHFASICGVTRISYCYSIDWNYTQIIGEPIGHLRIRVCRAWFVSIVHHLGVFGFSICLYEEGKSNLRCLRYDDRNSSTSAKEANTLFTSLFNRMSSTVRRPCCRCSHCVEQLATQHTLRRVTHGVVVVVDGYVVAELCLFHIRT